MRRMSKSDARKNNRAISGSARFRNLQHPSGMDGNVSGGVGSERGKVAFVVSIPFIFLASAGNRIMTLDEGS
jgi:hypothetical protein